VAVETSHPGPVTEFEQWYKGYEVDARDGCLSPRDIGGKGMQLSRMFDRFKSEMDSRVQGYKVLEKLADGEVISPKDDLPNVSSGETAGLIRRIARNLVQNTPNVEVISRFNDDDMKGIFVRHILTSKIIGTDEYSNDMQQNLFASTKTALTLGFDCVIPVLLQDAGGGWYMKYDSIHYRDVFPEPGCRDVRQATSVFVRRYLTKGEVMQLIKDEAYGWDINALRALLKTAPRSREAQSVDHQSSKRGQVPEGYEIITWYSSSGDPFLTFSANNKHLLRIEKNKHPLKLHPVHFLVLEKDAQQPLGKSQVELLIGRQDFQDLMLNGAMKLWYRNINPSIIGYGAVNSVPNLSPGKYTSISNPNAKIEPFEVNTGTLMQYGQISEQNLGSMVSLIGAADQQMATQSGNGMSATPQGVEAQQAMVDITTNNYQKAIESFFSHYCSYALTMYFQELKAVKAVKPTAEARLRLLQNGLNTEDLKDDGSLEIDFETLANEEYFVRCVPGSLTELEDEKQMRLLNELFIPLSQAMPALANAQDQSALQQASRAMQYIIQKQIELSGSSSALALKELWTGTDGTDDRDARIAALEQQVNGLGEQSDGDTFEMAEMMGQMQQQISLLTQANQLLLEKLGVMEPGSGSTTSTSAPTSSGSAGQAPTVLPASA
jgi:hypothetical protein